MGATISIDQELHNAAEHSLRMAKSRLAKQKKILLLGSADSGKSTVLKQMRLVHNVPFTMDELENYRQIVFQNITVGFRPVLDALEELHLRVSDDLQTAQALVMDEEYNLKAGEPFPPLYLQPLKTLWTDPQIRTVWERRSQFALSENLQYYFNSIDQLFESTYVPTNLDVLQCQVRTLGIAENLIPVGTNELLVVDVGGQRTERRKWIHCFEDVSAILFIVSLNGYDQVLKEDHSANQMVDAMQLWEKITRSRWFKRTAFVLLMNKNDLFEEKINRSNIAQYFPDYAGPEGNAQAGREYFTSRFTTLFRTSNTPGRALYAHTTTAIDTDMLRTVISATEEMILRSNLTRTHVVA